MDKVTITMPREAARVVAALVASEQYTVRAAMLRILRDDEPGDDARVDACLVSQTRAYTAMHDARQALADACDAADVLTWEERIAVYIARLLDETRERTESTADIVRMVKGLRMAMRATNAADALED